MSTPALMDLPASFVFSRGRAAPYRSDTGQIVMAAADVPRFDHDAQGRPLGLLIEGRPQTRHADVLTCKPGAWETGKATVLHEFTTPAGELKRRACYVLDDHRATVDGFMNTKGWHRQIIVLPGHLKNIGGAVRWRRFDWVLSAILAIEPGVAVGVTPETLLLEG